MKNTTNAAELCVNDIVRPVCDGEDRNGRIVRSTAARMRVTYTFNDNGKQYVELVVIRFGGKFQGPRRRLTHWDAEMLTRATL